MDNPLNVMTFIIIASMVILVFGYTWRHKHWGPVIILLGVLSMLSSILYRIVLALP